MDGTSYSKFLILFPSVFILIISAQLPGSFSRFDPQCVQVDFFSVPNSLKVSLDRRCATDTEETLSVDIKSIDGAHRISGELLLNAESTPLLLGELMPAKTYQLKVDELNVHTFRTPTFMGIIQQIGENEYNVSPPKLPPGEKLSSGMLFCQSDNGAFGEMKEFAVRLTDKGITATPPLRICVPHLPSIPMHCEVSILYSGGTKGHYFTEPEAYFYRAPDAGNALTLTKLHTGRVVITSGFNSCQHHVLDSFFDVNGERISSLNNQTFAYVNSAKYTMHMENISIEYTY